MPSRKCQTLVKPEVAFMTHDLLGNAEAILPIPEQDRRPFLAVKEAMHDVAAHGLFVRVVKENARRPWPKACAA